MKVRTFAGLTVALIFACIPVRTHAQGAAPGAPSMPGAPSPPSVPGTSLVPGAPSVPAVPSAPSAPGGSY
jgi:hypothetical protein